MNTFLFSARCADTEAVLFWDKPLHVGADASYVLQIDGKNAAVCSRTHHTLDNLTPDTAYHAEIWLAGKPDFSMSSTKPGLFLAACDFRTAQPRPRIDVTAAPYGAAGDGQAMDTAALQAAIDACPPGGSVYFPAGTYLTGALDLHGDMEFYLDADAVLQGSEDPADYLPLIRSRFEGIERDCCRSLLNFGTLCRSGYSCENVVLRGSGTISGGGAALAKRTIKAERLRLADDLAANPDLAASCENDSTIPGRVRGRLLNFSSCRNVWIHGLTLQNGASWNVHMIYSDNVVTDHCCFKSDGIWNGDGWDPDSSTNCTLFASRFYTEDDSVAIKSGKNPEGSRIARPSAHIRVFDCVSVFGHGICIGSEMSGGVEDVRIWDCDVANSLSGIEIKGTPKRGGYVRDVVVQDSVFPRLQIHSVPYNDDGIPAPEPPVFENFRFERLRLTGRILDHGKWETAKPILIEGFAAPGHEIRNVVIRDCHLEECAAGIQLEKCAEVTLENLSSVPPRQILCQRISTVRKDQHEL